MIKKLKTYPRPLPNNPVVVENIGMDNESLFNKINELCDAVNELQERVNDHEQAFDDCARDITKTETMLKNINTIVGSLITDNNTHKKQIGELQTKVNKMAQNLNFAQPDVKENFTTDPYAEQRKWIGKLCRFRDNPAFEWKYGILDRIYEDTDFPFWDTDCYEYAECEPVKPTDSIIYKGGDNE